MDSLLWSLLGLVLLPLWLAAGLVDYWAHQRTAIAQHSGFPESLLHFAQTGQVGIALLIVLFLHINFLTLAMIVACVVAHTLTAYADLRYTNGRRDITPLEQMAHAVLITLPVFATMLIVVLHWGQLTAADVQMAGSVASTAAMPSPKIAGTFDPWKLALRDPPWSMGTIVSVLAVSLLFGLLPGLAELRQTASAARQARHD